MKIYALPRKDGGVEIMYTAKNPSSEVAKWHPDRQAELTGVIKEIYASDLPANRAERMKWQLSGDEITVKT